MIKRLLKPVMKHAAGGGNRYRGKVALVFLQYLVDYSQFGE